MLKRTTLFVGLLAAPPVMADYVISNDTYIDSEVLGSTDNTHTNYGHNAAVKAVSNGPGGNSIVHALFTLPTGFWNNLQPVGSVPTTTVSYYFRNNSLATNDPSQNPNSVKDPNSTSGYYYRQLELHPLTEAFVAGTGGNGGSTSAGAVNAKAGADWATSDGTNAWVDPSTGTTSTTGAPYSSSFVYSNTISSAQGVYSKVTWDITAWLNDAATRSLLQNDGLLIKVTDENAFTGNEFASLISYDGAGYVPTSGSNSYAGYYPTVTPEPAALASLAAAGVLLVRRRRTA